jgi:hypothetical protein
MNWPDRDSLHRTAKLLVDSGRASSPDDAVAILESFVLQVDIGPGIENLPAAQAGLGTLVNAGHRAFLGGVAVRAEEDPVLTEGWAAGRRLSTVVAELGGRMTQALSPDIPTIVVGEPTRPSTGRIVLWTTWAGWAGGVVEDPNHRLDGDGMTLSGVVAGALGVSEAFQHVLGSSRAGHRNAGLSLWRPDLPWHDPDGIGPPLSWLPSTLWLLGLGHLGQGYAWSLGWLPYATPTDVMVFLMDTDIAIGGNKATGLLLRDADVGHRKTRVVAARLEGDLGIRTGIVERRFDDTLWPGDDEPLLALAGFDRPEPRRQLGGQRSGEPRFGRVIDAGLGSGPVEYLDMLIHTFPSQLDPATAFPDQERRTRSMPAAYAAEIERMVRTGTDIGDATCGMTQAAGISVAAAFVGAMTGAIVIGDVLRHMHGGREVAILSLDLRSPAYIDAPENTAPGTYFNPGSTAVR